MVERGSAWRRRNRCPLSRVGGSCQPPFGRHLALDAAEKTSRRKALAANSSSIRTRSTRSRLSRDWACAGSRVVELFPFAAAAAVRRRDVADLYLAVV